MKTKFKVIFLLSTIGIIFLITLVSIKLFEHKKSAAILYERNLEKQNSLTNTLTLLDGNFKMFASDYSRWDELVNFISTHDKVWASENIEIALPIYEIQSAWIYDKNCNLVYSFSTVTDSSRFPFPLSGEELQKIFRLNHFNSFFLKTSLGVIQIKTAPIQPSYDAERKTPPKGFLLVGKIWSKDYLKKISSIIDAEVKLTSPVENNIQATNEEFKITASIDLLDNNQNTIARLIATSKLPIFKKTVELFNFQFFLIVIFSILILTSVYIFLFLFVVKPLKLIAQSLKENDPSLIQTMKKDKSEFGDLAFLIDNFFRQREKLIFENSERQKAERDLNKLNRIYAIINEINQMMIRARDSQKLFNEICKIAVLQGKFKFSLIALTNSDLNSFHISSSYGSNENLIEKFKIIFEKNRNNERFFFAYIKKGGVFIVNDISTSKMDASLREVLCRENISSFASLPISCNSHAFGVLVLFSEERNFFDAQEVLLLEEVMVDINFALEMIEKERQKSLAEESLRQSEERWQVVVESSGSGMWDWNIKTNECFFSAQWKRLLGYEADEIQNHFSEWEEKIYKEDFDFVQNRLNRHLKNDSPFFMCDYRMVCKDGTTKWFLSRGKVIKFDENGNPLRMVGTNEDINKRKIAEEALYKSEQRYKELIENQGEGVLIGDKNEVITFINPAGEKLFGLPKEKIIGHSLKDFVSEKNYQTILEKTENRKKGVEESYEIEIKQPSGDKKTILVSATPRFSGNNYIGAFGIFRDITERKRAEDQIRKLSQSLVQSPVSIIITDLNGTIEYVNPKCCEVTGYSCEELVGKNPRIFKTSEKSTDDYKKLWETIILGNEWTGEFHNKKKNGELFWESAIISPIKDENGLVTNFLAIKEDITQRKKMEQELIAAKEKAEEMNRLKTNFLANMNHELRTPMIGILGYSEILKNLADKQEEKDMAETIYLSGTRLMETLNLILDLSRIEADKLEINFIHINLNKLINEVIAQFEPQARKKNILLQKLFTKEIVVGELDERMTQQVVYNLVSNAVKFTKHGGVLIELQKEMDYAVIKIKDTGIGIAKENLQIIFDEFRQVSEGFGRGFEGVGLGLTIVNKFVQKMNGTISVESKVGIGTEFTVKLPLFQNRKARKERLIQIAGSKRISLDKSETEKQLPEILLVEDDVINQQIIKLYLKNICRVDLVDNATEAIQKSVEKNYSAILMDINLGLSTTGLDATREIKKLKAYKNIPIVAVTAFVMPGDQEEFMAAGCTHYLPKPFSRKAIIQLMEEILS